MNCKKCGTRLADEWKCCPTCGEEVKRDDVCTKCGYKLLPEWKTCPSCGTQIGEERSEANGENTTGTNEGGNSYFYGGDPNGKTQGNYYYGQPGSAFYTPPTPIDPMKWYNFLIKFFIWFIAAVNFLAAISTIGTMSLAGDIAALMEMFGIEEVQIATEMLSGINFKAYCIFSAVTNMALGAYAIRVGILLRQKSKKALSALVALLAASPVIVLVGGIFFPVFVGLWKELPGSIIGNGLLIWANIVYFNKRRDIFVN